MFVTINPPRVRESYGPWANPKGGLILKYQIPSTKLQTNLKFQYSMTKTGLEFGILVIVICLIFVICDLEFLFLQYSKTALN
ncbi:MAG: hypothetical protein DRG34_04895 [Deltaproteobacteria bacterium]|nr:MAG: hypothetical protein DRG34_04895 [Deltaproteobacteria bacterium]